MKKSLLIGLSYILWLASAALTLWGMLVLRVILLIDLPTEVLNVNPWRLPAIDKFGTLILAVLWLIFVIVTEPYFRRFAEQELAVVNLVKVFVAELVFLGAVYGVSWLW